jgi:hypothetical protein
VQIAQSLRSALSLGADIVNNSWGTFDAASGQGASYSPADPAWRQALDEGLTSGRQGKGAVVVFAAGNGGRKDDSNRDGYANHPGVLAVAAVDASGRPPAYAEPGSNVLVSDEGLHEWIVKLGAGLKRVESSGSRFEVFGAASLMSFARKVSDDGFSGLEFAAGIPAWLPIRPAALQRQHSPKKQQHRMSHGFPRPIIPQDALPRAETQDCPGGFAGASRLAGISPCARASPGRTPSSAETYAARADRPGAPVDGVMRRPAFITFPRG